VRGPAVHVRVRQVVVAIHTLGHACAGNPDATTSR
jgi:hypothetical protein